VAGLVSAQLLLYPAMRRQFESASCIANANGPGLTNDEMKWYWTQFLSGAAPAADDVRAFPLAEPFERPPSPALIVAAAHDPLYDDAFELARFLETKGGRVELIDAIDMTHGFGRIQAYSPAAAAYMKRVAARIGEMLR
jgi:acetyl esterase